MSEENQNTETQNNTPAPQAPEEYLDDTPEESSPAQEAGGSSTEAIDSASSDEENKKNNSEKDYPLKSQNVEVKYPVFLNVDKFNKDAITISMPASFRDYVIERIGDAPNTPLDDSNKAGLWSRVMQSGMSISTMEDIYRSSLERDDTAWAQSVDNNGKDLMGVAPQLTSVSGEALSGERGTLRFLRFAGLGSVFMVPLWHTGIWITLKAPSDARLLELNREMSMDKIQLGRATYGLALSSVVSVFSERLVDLAMEHLYSSNLKTDKNLLDVISSHDIPSIVWGMACVIWNNGFQYERACTHDPEKCNHVVQEKLDVTKLQWVNKKALTPWQIAHMGRKKSGAITLEDVERYKKESLDQQPRRIQMSGEGDNSYYFDLHVPTIREYFEHSNDWINSVVNSVEKAMTMDPSDNQRAKFIEENAQSTIMRQYVHWVESIGFDDNVISDKSTIENIFDRLSADEEINLKFVEEVRKYINDSALAVIGIPTYDCPSCGKKQQFKPLTDSMVGIIPLDMLQTFFYLLVQKILLIMRR